MKLTIDIGIFKHLVDLLGIQSATALFIGVFVALVTVHSTDYVVKKVPLGITTTPCATFDCRNHLIKGQLRYNDDLLLLGWLFLVFKWCLNKIRRRDSGLRAIL
jgi:hypothetical protein